MNGKVIASVILPLLITCIAVSPALLIRSPPPITHQIITQLTSGSSSNIDPVFDPSGTAIAYASKTPDSYFQIYTMDSSGNHKVRLTALPGNATNPQWSPNGEEIAFLESEQGRSNIWTVSSEGQSLTRITRSQEILNFQWSPDSSRIVYEVVVNGTSAISIVNVVSGQSSLLLSGDSREYRTPVWCLNSSSIIFSSNLTGSYHIWVVNDQDSGLKQLTSGNGSDANPELSPDGSTLLYTSNKSGHWDIWALNFKSGVDMDVTAVSSQAMGSELFIDGLNPNVHAVWSPNGSRILFSDEFSGNNSLYIAQGSTVTTSLFGRVATNSSEYFISALISDKSVLGSSCGWSPDGSQITYSAKVSGTFQLFLTLTKIVQPKSSYG